VEELDNRVEGRGKLWSGGTEDFPLASIGPIPIIILIGPIPIMDAMDAEGGGKSILSIGG